MFANIKNTGKGPRVLNFSHDGELHEVKVEVGATAQLKLSAEAFKAFADEYANDKKLEVSSTTRAAIVEEVVDDNTKTDNPPVAKLTPAEVLAKSDEFTYHEFLAAAKVALEGSAKFGPRPKKIEIIKALEKASK